MAEAWAVVSGVEGDTGGFTVLHHLDGRWQIVGGSGGACGPRYAYALGIPSRLWDLLLGVRVSPEERAAVLGSGPCWTRLTSKNDLIDSDLSGRSWWELVLMRNEIFARHGRSFQDPELRAYFEGKAWYRANPAYQDGLLSRREVRNANFILDYQRRHGLTG